MGRFETSYYFKNPFNGIESVRRSLATLRDDEMPENPFNGIESSTVA